MPQIELDQKCTVWERRTFTVTDEELEVLQQKVKTDTLTDSDYCDFDVEYSQVEQTTEEMSILENDGQPTTEILLEGESIAHNGT
jgi:hypothetical protein